MLDGPGKYQLMVSCSYTVNAAEASTAELVHSRQLASSPCSSSVPTCAAQVCRHAKTALPDVSDKMCAQAPWVACVFVYALSMFVCLCAQGIISHMGSNTACGHYVAHVKKVRIAGRRGNMWA